jgi:hypothetical protein
MGRLILLASVIFLAGCSELKVITDAAVRELRADAIAVAPAEETTLVRPEKERERNESRVLMAKADWRSTDWRYGKAQAREPKKGLWEVN